MSISALLAVACACDDDDSVSYTPPVNTGVSYIVEGGTTANELTQGATITPGTKSIVFKFDQNIAITMNTKYTLNGDSISIQHVTLDAAQKTLTIDLPALKNGTDYTLTISGDNVSSYGLYTYEGKTNGSEVSISFKTTPVKTSLSNGSASQAAKNVYNFLVDNYQKKILSSTMSEVNWNLNGATQLAQTFGAYPAIATVDYIQIYATEAVNPDWHPADDYKDISMAQEWWNNNGLFSAGWHWMVPLRESCVGSDTVQYAPGTYTYIIYEDDEAKDTIDIANEFNLTTALDESTWQHKQLLADLDVMHANLKLLADAGIPVLWRPLHEASGAWFWWGTAADQNQAPGLYKKLWQLMYERFADLNNLIWVWTTQVGDKAWYPGDEYVDIVGLDIYKKNAVDIHCQWRQTQADYPDKIITLSECGSIPTIGEMWNSKYYRGSSMFSYFMPWYSQYSYKVKDENDKETEIYELTPLEPDSKHSQHATYEWWYDALSTTGELVITRNEMPSLK